MNQGNFHTFITYNSKDKARARKLIRKVQKQSCDLDKTVTGEHGLGLEFRDELEYELGRDSVDTMRQIQAALDPLFLLVLL
jgi:FAD/FMN-containing dehydrogenase